MAIDAIARNKAEALIREQLVNTIQQDVPQKLHRHAAGHPPCKYDL